MTTFHKRLKELRISKNLSQQKLADDLCINKQTISQYERGVRQPNLEMLLILCDYFNVNSDFLLGHSDVTGRLLDLEEIELIENYRKLSPEQKQLVKRMLVFSDKNNG